MTLVGRGGVGKTRLALAIVGRLLDRFAQGAVFVDLAPVREAALVLPAIAEALGLRDALAACQLAQYLRDQQVLLVLDNFEQVLSAGRHLAALLEAGGEFKLLVTSREALHLRWEHQFAVRPLAVPLVAERVTPDLLGRVASVALFVERAQAVQPAFCLTDDNAPTVAAICRRLEGLPLAIELAAAHLERITLRAVLARSDRRLELLTGGARDLPRRHQTLRAVIAWSYDLLDAREQTLFRRLGVFVGGATADAIRAITRTSGDDSDDMVRGLDSLISKNLLREEELADGEVRFSLLSEDIREFALERLASSGELESTLHEHAAYLLGLAESVDVESIVSVGPEVGAWLERLEHEQANLRAVLRRAAQVGDAEFGVRLAGALWPFWHVRSLFTEGRDWLHQFLAMS